MSVRMLLVEDFGSPEEHHHLGGPDVFDAVCHAWRDIDHLEVRSRYPVLGDFSPKNRPKTDDGIAVEHAEFLDFQIVVMVATSDPGMRAGHEHLAEVR